MMVRAEIPDFSKTVEGPNPLDEDDMAVISRIDEEDQMALSGIPDAVAIMDPSVEEETNQSQGGKNGRDKRRKKIVIKNILDNQRASAKRKEDCALAHLKYFINEYFSDKMPPNYTKKVDIEPRTFICTGKSEEGMNFRWWDSMIGSFVGYLSVAATTARRVGQKRLCYESASGYASSVKAYYTRKFRNDAEIPIFKEESWRNCRFQLRKEYEEHCRATGESMSNPHLASTASDRRGIAHAALYLGTSRGAEFWHLNNTTTQFPGRGSEVALNHISHMGILDQYEGQDYYEIIYSDIRRFKTGQKQRLPLFIHRDRWEECWYTSLIYNIIMMDSKDFQNGYIFPTFSRHALRTSSETKSDSKVSSYWRECFQAVYTDLSHLNIQINQKLTSHCGKKGANQHMAELNSVSPLAQIFRSGWEVRNIHSLFDYVIGTPRLMQQAGKAVSNWTTKVGDLVIGGKPPTLNCLLDDPDFDKAQEFVNLIFKFDGEQQWPKPIRDLLVASLFRHYNDMVTAVKMEPTGQYSNLHNHRFFAVIRNRMMDAGVEEEVLQRWCTKVKDSFLQRNFAALPIQCFEHLRGTPDDPLIAMRCDPRTLMDNYNSMAQLLHTQAMTINRLEDSIKRLHLTVALMAKDQSKFTSILQNQVLAMRQLSTSIQHNVPPPNLFQDQDEYDRTSQDNQSFDSLTPNLVEGGTKEDHSTSSENDDGGRKNWEDRDPKSVIPFSLVIKDNENKKMSLKDHFVFFFEHDVMLAYDLDKKSHEEWRARNPTKLTDAVTNKRHSQKKTKLANQVQRTKRATRVLLYFCTKFPPYPRPRLEEHQRVWRRTVNQIGEEAQKALIDELYPLDPPESLTVDPFLGKPKTQASCFIWDKAKNWFKDNKDRDPLKEKFAPMDTPEPFLEFLAMNKEPSPLQAPGAFNPDSPQKPTQRKPNNVSPS